MISIRIRDPVLFRPLDPGWEKHPDSGSGMNILDHFSESLEIVFGLKILQINSLIRIRIRDLGSF